MSFKSVATKSAVLRIVGVMTVAAAALVSVSVYSEPIIRVQSGQRATPPKVRLPDEAAGIDGIVGALISVYDQFDVVALGESHGRRPDSDLRIALVRHPDFAKKVQTIVVEFGSATEQTILDRYVRGENVSRAQLERVWKTLSPGNIGDLAENPIYTDFFATVREVNSRLPAATRIRVFGGDPGAGGDRATAGASILKEQVLQKRGKALVIYGQTHFWRAYPDSGLIGLVKTSKVRPRTKDTGAASTGTPPTIALQGFHGRRVPWRKHVDLQPRPLREHIQGQHSYSRSDG